MLPLSLKSRYFLNTVNHLNSIEEAVLNSSPLAYNAE
jgi:hypothetical protein